ncbi:MmcB family DNA repair protein [Rhizosaccharibacter radicis]|uniref:MmcB family DNA repair protein n=1 Tax=Rhizosaccharibacter radicis TaxID=2782605 RepID=A0ABT1W0U6_9PROT|nr:MmcB family DNA repair protein [Acetobacteraceae bacterium KSS12]
MDSLPADLDPVSAALADAEPAVPAPGDLTLPEIQLAIRRAAARLCGQLNWAVLHEVPLPNNRRADILALRPDGGFCCIEVKSGARDFLCDNKWPEYRDYCDALLFAVDDSFPQALLPPDVGLIVACVGPHCRPGGVFAEAELLREPPAHPLSPARRRQLTHRFATLAASRLAMLEDPAITASLRAARRVE